MHLKFLWSRTLPTSGFLALFLVAGAAAEQKFIAAEVGGVPEQYLVMLADGAARGPDDTTEIGPSVVDVATELAELYGGSVERTWESALGGFQIRASETDAQRLASDPAIRWVQQDRTIMNLGNLPQSCYGFDSATRAPDQGFARTIVCDDPDPRNPNRHCVDNWGLDRIDQTSGVRDGLYNYTASVNPVHVFVLDTGIFAEHWQFEEWGPPWTRVIAGFNAILGGDPTDTEDCYGHGTHVAGIIGGRTTGVTHDVWLHPVKYLDRCGGPEGGNFSDLVNGLNWIHANHDPSVSPAVINLSVNWPFRTEDLILQEAVASVLAKGFTFVQSAGNQNDNLSGQPIDACDYSMGGAPGLEAVIIAGGTDANQGLNPIDGRWIREPDDPSAVLCSGSNKDCGSNSGSCVDVWAPAAHIISASHNPNNTTELCRLSGTSMAAPHVTGAATLYLQNNQTATPAQVQQAIVNGATCGALDSDPSSPYYIGEASPNLLLNSLFNGGGPTSCSQPPVCQDDAFSTPQDTELLIHFSSLLGNDSDPDGDYIAVIDYDPTTTQGGTNHASNQGGFHYTPPAGYFGPDSMTYTIDDSQGLTATCTIDLTVTPPSVLGEFGRVTNLTHVAQTVILSHSYANPVVIAQPPSHNGPKPSVVRITSVQPDRFTFYIDEAPDGDGLHARETVSYLVVEAGSWQLADGTELRAGTFETSNTVGKRVNNIWSTVSYGATFPATPVVLSQVQTNNDPSFVKTRHNDVFASSFNVALEKDEESTISHGTETIGWFAIAPASGTWSGHPYAAARTLPAVTEAWYLESLPVALGSSRHFLAAMSTYNGDNNAGLRYQRLKPTSVEIMVEEDTTWDQEVNHGHEVVDYLILEGAGNLEGTTN